jgi:Fic family protein
MNMKPLRYRIEKKSLPSGELGYYLVKDIRVGRKKAKVTSYLGEEAPRPDTIDAIVREHYLKLELKAAYKKAELSSSQYLIDYLDEKKGKELLELLEKTKYLCLALDSLLYDDEMEEYEKQFELQYVHGTTSIEGNTLSLNDVRLLMEEGIAPSGKDLREMFEVLNFKEVKKYRDHYKKKVTLDFIKKIHSLVMNNIQPESAGVFRRIDSIGISGRDFQLTPAIEIENELQEIIDEYYARVESGYCPFFEALVFHHKFELIHPFTNGNGRVGREVLNYMLMREKCPRLLFLGKDRGKYLSALMKADDGDYGSMIYDMAMLIIDQRLHSVQKQLDNLGRYKTRMKIEIKVPDSLIDSNNKDEWKPFLKAD